MKPNAHVSLALAALLLVPAGARPAEDAAESMTAQRGAMVRLVPPASYTVPGLARADRPLFARDGGSVTLYSAVADDVLTWPLPGRDLEGRLVSADAKAVTIQHG